MTGSVQDDGLAAALIQIAAHAEQIGGLDARETSHHQDTTTRLRALTDEASAARARMDAIHDTLSRQAVILDGLDGLDRDVAALAHQLTLLAGTSEDDDDSASDRYQPVLPPPWWKVNDLERQLAVDRLRAWVSHVYQPGYGRLAAMLPACWEQHPLCLYVLDWLSELWSVLYLSPPPRRQHPRRPGRMAHPAPARRRRADGLRKQRLPAHQCPPPTASDRPVTPWPSRNAYSLSS